MATSEEDHQDSEEGLQDSEEDSKVEEAEAPLEAADSISSGEEEAVVASTNLAVGEDLTNTEENLAAMVADTTNTEGITNMVETSKPRILKLVPNLAKHLKKAALLPSSNSSKTDTETTTTVAKLALLLNRTSQIILFQSTCGNLEMAKRSNSEISRMLLPLTSENITKIDSLESSNLPRKEFLSI